MENEIRRKAITKVTLAGSLVNLALVIFKFAAGMLGRSAAMIADAVHSLSDFATDIVVLIFIRISSKPKDDDHKYGHGKFETLATAIIGVVLFAVGLKLMIDSCGTIIGVLFRGETIESPGTIALVAAVVSIVSKEILYRYTMVIGRKFNSSSVIANAWHHRSDVFSSIGTALGIGGAILLGEKWNVLDPIAAAVVSILIMKVAIELLMPAMNELLEKSLPVEEEQEIIGIIGSAPGVSDPHNLRTRRIGNCCAIEIHIRVRGDMPVEEAHEITRLIENKLLERFGSNSFVNVHVEPLKPGMCCSDERR